MTFGKHTYGNPIIHWGANESKLTIGNYCSIGENVNIHLGGGEGGGEVNLIDWKNISGNVIIGNDIWIGNNVTIMSGVIIGDGATIATNSFIAKNVEPYSFVKGNPARIIDYKFSKEQIEKLLAIKWWEWSDAKIYKYTSLLASQNVDYFIKKALNSSKRNE
jgi:acetyltransferase-like isoleucine patch superfamily enzyme